MIVDERMIDFIHSLDIEQEGYLNTIKKQALEEGVPIIRQETVSLLSVLVSMTKPKQLLEVGAAVGFSALLMCEHMPEDGHITTIENYEKRIVQAKANFKMAGKEDRITLLEGDAMEILSTLDAGFDFIFMDAAKAQYIHFLPEITRLLKTGGTLVSDNVLQDGDVIESRYGVTRRNRTIHSRMREYLWTLTHSEQFKTTVLPIGDGVTISIKK